MPAPRLSGLDAACLELERADTPQHTVAVLTIDAPATRPHDPADTLVHAVRALVARSERLRSRIVEAPLALGPPRLVVGDGPIDLDVHLARLRLPRPGGPRQLGRAVDEILSRPLPRGVPPWSMHLVEGLDSGATALVIALHVVPLDGTTAWQLGLALADPPTAAPPFAATAPGADANDATREAAARAPVGFGAPALGVARATARLAGRALAGLGPGARDASPRPRALVGTRLDAPVDGDRRSARATLRAASVDEVAKVFDVAADTVVLACVAEALRGELAAGGRAPTRPLVALVAREGAEAPGPRRGWPRFTLERIPAHVALPAARLRMLHREAATASAWPARGVVDDVDTITGSTAPALMSLAFRMVHELDVPARVAPFANLLVTLARDVRQPPHIGGARVEHVHAYGPLQEGLPLHVTALRVGGAIDVGIQAAGDVLPDPWRFAVRLGDALGTLHEAALALDSR